MHLIFLGLTLHFSKSSCTVTMVVVASHLPHYFSPVYASVLLPKAAGICSVLKQSAPSYTEMSTLQRGPSSNEGQRLVGRSYPLKKLSEASRLWFLRGSLVGRSLEVPTEVASSMAFNPSRCNFPHLCAPASWNISAKTWKITKSLLQALLAGKLKDRLNSQLRLF